MIITDLFDGSTYTDCSEIADQTTCVRIDFTDDSPEDERQKVVSYHRCDHYPFKDMGEVIRWQIANWTSAVNWHHDNKLVTLYADLGFNERNKHNNTARKRMLDEITTVKPDLIVMRNYSRFSRNTAELCAFIREMMSMGINVHFTEECLDTRFLEGMMILEILEHISQAESRSISAGILPSKLPESERAFSP